MKKERKRIINLSITLVVLILALVVMSFIYYNQFVRYEEKNAVNIRGQIGELAEYGIGVMGSTPCTIDSDCPIGYRCVNQECVSKNLVAYFKFEGNINDVSGNGNDADVGGLSDNFFERIKPNLWSNSTDATFNTTNNGWEGRVYINHPAVGVTQGMISKFNLSGDFDVQIEYLELDLRTCGYGKFSSIGMNISGTGVPLNVERRSGDYLYTDYSGGGSQDRYDDSSSGKFRIKRTGTMATIYRSDGINIWKSNILVGTGDINIILYGRGECSAEGMLDNLIITGVNNGFKIVNNPIKGYVGGFNGISGVLSIPNNNALTIDSWSLGAWVYADSDQNPWAPVIQKGDAFGGTNYGLRVIQDGQTWQCFNIYCTANQNPDGSLNCTWPYVNGSIIKKNAWHYLACTYDGIDTIKIYEDGILTGSANIGPPDYPYGGNKSHPNAPVGIGAGVTGQSPSRPFKGLIDDASIWNISLSQQEIQQEFYKGAECLNDSDCQTGEICIIGKCININCSQDTDCGTNGFTGELFCSTGNVFRNYTNFTCNYPGTSGSYCSNSTIYLINKTCSVGQTCSNGQCFGDFNCTSNSDCDDSDSCTNDICNITSGDCTRTFNISITDCGCNSDAMCDDSNLCTTESCNNQTHMCIRANNTLPCYYAGDLCRTNGTCALGICTAGPVKNCSDNNNCTSDSCNANGQCENNHVGCPCTNTTQCQSGNVCINDFCNSTTSRCAVTYLDIICNDSNPNSIFDWCLSGSCTGQVKCNNNHSCDPSREENCSNCAHDCGNCSSGSGTTGSGGSSGGGTSGGGTSGTTGAGQSGSTTGTGTSGTGQNASAVGVGTETPEEKSTITKVIFVLIIIILIIAIFIVSVLLVKSINKNSRGKIY